MFQFNALDQAQSYNEELHRRLAILVPSKVGGKGDLAPPPLSPHVTVSKNRYSQQMWQKNSNQTSTSGDLRKYVMSPISSLLRNQFTLRIYEKEYTIALKSKSIDIMMLHV